MAFSPTADSQMAAAQSIARSSPQVARIISPPVADTTWPQTGQVLAGATRRRRHSLPQPVVPDVPHENTCTVKQNLPQHMDLDSSAHKSSPIIVNPNMHNPFKNTSGVSRQQHTVASPLQSTVHTSSTQSRTLNGITMDLDYEPPTSQPMNFGGGFEQGIPFTRPPQLTLHSPTNDNKSKGSHPGLGKSHFSSMAARKAARQHHFHERRGAQLHRIQLGGKRHLADLDLDDQDDDDGYYTSSGPACKQFINEERMAARMNNLNISGGNSSAGSSFSSMWQAAPAHNSQRFEWQNSRKLPTFAELESRLSDSDPSEDESEFRLEYAPELRKALRKKDGPLPEALAQQMNPHCLQLVLWQPPAAILEEKIKVTPSNSSSPPTNRPANASRNSPASASIAEASMECTTEPFHLTPPTGAGGGRSGVSPEQRSVSPGTDWGANVQLFDSVDDDDMDL